MRPGVFGEVFSWSWLFSEKGRTFLCAQTYSRISTVFDQTRFVVEAPAVYTAGMTPLLLHAHHASQNASFCQLGGREAVEAFTSLQEEYEAMTRGRGLLDFSFRECLAVTGPDRQTFLQGMCSQNLSSLQEGESTYATFLTSKGAMVSDARILVGPDVLWLDVEPGTSSTLWGHLSKFLVSEDAEVADVSSDWALVSLLGPDCTGVAVPSGTWALPHLLPDVAGVDFLVPRARLPEVYEALRATPGTQPVGHAAWNSLRVEQGIPRFGEDMGPTTLPLEARLERALHYNKGCYLGQEVVARATFRGHMNRLLAGFLLGQSPLPVGTEFLQNDKKVAWLTSVAFSPRRKQWVALGYAHRDFLSPGTRLSAPNLPDEAIVSALPF